MKKVCSKVTWLMIVLLMAVSLTLTSCSSFTPTTKAETSTNPTPSASPALTPKSGGILKVVPRNTSPVFGYPGDLAQMGAVDISYPCLEALCFTDARGGFLPRLATAAQFAQDGKSVTFTLRKGIKFHDGTDFNATAAKWNLDLSKKARIAGTEQWTSTEVIDDYTVRINLKQYQNAIFSNMAINSSQMSSPTAFDKLGVDKIHTYPVGTGPFKFVSYTADVGVKYERNDDYWGGKPYLDGVEVVFIADDMARAAALQSGGVDILFNVTSETANSLRSKGYNLGNGAQDQIQTMFPDSANTDSPLSNLKVRQAIEYAIDRKALSELGNGFWIPLTEMSTPTTVGYISGFEGRQYNLVKAKQLLTEAGFANGFDTKIIYSPTLSAPQDSMVAVQQFLSKIGINVELQPLSGPDKSAVYSNGWKNGLIVGSTYGGPTYISAISRNLEPTGKNVYVSTARPSGWDDLLKQVGTASDDATYENLSQKIVMTIYDDTTVIPLWAAPQNIFVQQNYVQDAGIFKTGSTFSWTPEKVWLNK
jgi:ABC-type transport system substrate-binding protein